MPRNTQQIPILQTCLQFGHLILILDMVNYRSCGKFTSLFWTLCTYGCKRAFLLFGIEPIMWSLFIDLLKLFLILDFKAYPISWVSYRKFLLVWIDPQLGKLQLSVRFIVPRQNVCPSANLSNCFRSRLSCNTRFSVAHHLGFFSIESISWGLLPGSIHVCFALYKIPFFKENCFSKAAGAACCPSADF